jgi:signal transduction histidine kinase
LSKTVNVIVAHHRPQAQQQKVNIELKRAPQDLRVMGVANELKQVFLNILLNALQALPEGGVIQCVSEESLPEISRGAHHWAQVQISDTGIGIAPDLRDKIFDPFFTTKREGTGLGLSVCHGVIQRHEGEIDIRSEVGKGTTVSVRLQIV